MQCLTEWTTAASRGPRIRSQLRSRSLSKRFSVMEKLEQRIVLSAITPQLNGPGSDGNGLRDAIQQANSNGEDDIIYLSAGTWGNATLNGPTGQENAALTGDFDLTERDRTVIFEGAGAGITIIDGSQIDRVFHVHENVRAIFRNLTIANGLAYDSGFSGTLPTERPAMGGAILVEFGTLELDGVELRNNTARGADGAPSRAGRHAFGGAVAALNSEVTVANSVFSGNEATGGVGGPGFSGQSGGDGEDGEPGTDGGSGGSAHGAAIYSKESGLTISGSLFDANAGVGGRGGHGGEGGAGKLGGAGGNGGGGGQGGTVRGGALFFDEGALDVSASVFQNSRAVGGDAGHGRRGGSGGNSGGGGEPNGAFGGTSNVGGWAQGGAIWVGVGNVTVSGTRLIDGYLEGGLGGLGGIGGNGGNVDASTGGEGGSGGFGGEGGVAQGGGYFQNRGMASITESEIAGNEVVGGMGGPGGSGGRAGSSGDDGNPDVDGGNGAPGGRGGDGHGGGIYIQNVDAVVTNVTISGNQTSPGEGGLGGGQGTAQGNGDPGREGGTSPRGTSEGGGLWTDDAADMTLRSATISNNEAILGTASGVFNDGSLHFVMDNTIVAGNKSDDDIVGPINTTSSNNVIGNGSALLGVSDGLNGNQIGSVSNVLDAGLGLLQDNGGPTRTHALIAGSVAIDTGLRDVIPITDQRGTLRPLQSPVDIGAYEFQRSVVVTLPDGGGQYTLVADRADVVVKDALNVELFRYEYTALLDITIQASADADELLVDFSQGPVLPPDRVTFIGVEGAGDTLELIGNSATLITTYLNSPGSGRVSVDGPSVSFDNVLNVADRLTAGQRVFQFGANDDEARFEKSFEAGYVTVSSGASGEAIVTATVPTAATAVNGGDGNDTITIGVIDSTIAARMIVDGQNGDDFISGKAATVAVSVTGGAGGDTIWGGRGDDTLDGAGGDDWIFSQGGNDLVTGGDGVDRMSGNSGHDTLSGGAGRDSLYGGSGRDSLSGGDGDDVVLGQGGSKDTVQGGDGDDVLDGGAGIDYLNESGDVDFRITKSRLLGLGYDKLRFVEYAKLSGGDGDNFFDGREFTGRGVIFDGGAGNDSLLGSAGADLLVGQAGDDTLVGEDGDDSLHGISGNDVLIGGAGNDYLRGQDGDDALTGDDGLDRLFGDAGDDSLDGGNDADVADGGEGNDTISGGSGDDTLNGGDGDDHLSADAGNDVASGDAGHDSLDGGVGNDSLFGNDGNDRLFGSDDADELEGGSGDDDLHGQAGNDTLRGDGGHDWLFGDDGADSVDGGAGNDGVAGDDGNDIVLGGDGNDTLMGGAGADRLASTSGANLLLGEDGDDTLSGAGIGSDTLSSGDGIDVLENTDASDVEDDSAEVFATFAATSGRLTVLAKADATIIVRDRFGMVEVNVDGIVVPGLSSIAVTSVREILVRGSQGADVVDLDFVSTEMFTGFREDGVLMMGRGGNDSLIGSEFRDSILGGEGDDTILAGKHDDTVRGETGNDSIRGEDGEDLLVGDTGNDWLDGGDDADVIEGGDGDDTLRGGSGRDSLFGGSGNDGLAGHRDNDLLTGQSGDDTLLGGDGDDTLYGGGGEDTLLGEFGNDVVNGQGSTDLIAGGHGYGDSESGDRLIGPASEIDENFKFTAAWTEDF